MSNVAASKKFGQHWLRDMRVVGRIVDAIQPMPHEPVIEIGPGTGVLTRALLEAKAKLTVVELDSRCWPDLEPLPLTLVKGDALEVDWPELLAGGGQVVGNLPYNVGTEIVARLVRLAKPPRQMVFMLQKEVVQRICAQPGGKTWGRLGVLCDLYCKREYLFDVSPGAFSPPPKVMSAIVRLTPLPEARYPIDFKKFDTLLRLVFGQRRKMLRGLLKDQITEAQMTAIGVKATDRAEVLTTQQLCALAQLLA